MKTPRTSALKSSFALLVCAAALLGCDSSSGTLSCTESETVAGMTIMLCVEASCLNAQQETQLRQQCSTGVTMPGTGADGGISISEHVSDSPCSHVNALGGCKVTQGGITETGWYYQNGIMTAAVTNQIVPGLWLKRCATQSHTPCNRLGRAACPSGPSRAGSNRRGRPGQKTQ